MRKILAIAFTLLSIYSFGQNSHMSLGMGPSFPLGDFSAIDNYTENGYATNGFYLQFDGNYIPSWYFGIGGNISFASNFPNQDSMLTGLVEELRKMNVSSIPDEIETEFFIGNWSYINLMVGPTLALPAGKFQFNLKAFIGLSIVLPPNQTLTLKYDNTVISGYSDTQNTKFAYSVGGDIIYELSENYSLKIGAEYFATSTDYDMELGVQDDSIFPAISRSVNISSIHTTIGLAYLF